jgi:hypothetical protein
MTAAFAPDEYEYEVPLHGAPPAEAVERAVEGNVVRLTRDGQPVAVIESAELRLQNLRQRAEYLRQREQEMADTCRGMWQLVANDSEKVKAATKDLIDRVMAEYEDAADLAAVAVARAEGGEPIPADQVWAELGL